MAEDCGIARKTVEGYFDLLDDLLIAIRLPVFERRAKRKLVRHPKFYYFDCGVYRILRPKGPLDPAEEIEGPTIETLVLQELRAINAYLRFGYEFYFWRTHGQQEVDFILYGENGLLAIEVKRTSQFRERDLDSLREFCKDYPEATGYLFYTGTKRYAFNGIRVLPLGQALEMLPKILRNSET